jgi:nitrite reductase/ring-hydroxylating ferredoxin subunit
MVPKGSIPKALWWDTGDHEANASIPPYHYVRLHELDEDHDLLICGGEDHATGMADAEKVPEEKRYALLEDWLKKRFDILKVVYRWSGQVMEPMDSLAFIGRNPMDHDNVYIATGDSGNGLTHATIAVMLITDLINGKENPWEKIFDPGRVKWFSAGKTFFKEFVGGLVSYLLHKPDTDPEQIHHLKHDEGRVLKWNGKTCGLYRDYEDMLHIVDASCTHLQCTVKWNNDEKSWDCPCHGSRFTIEGKVMNGPANKDLPYHAEKLQEVPHEH